MSALMKRLSPFATTVRRETGKQVASPKGLVDRLLDTLFVWQARANERHDLVRSKPGPTLEHRQAPDYGSGGRLRLLPSKRRELVKIGAHGR